MIAFRGRARAVRLAAGLNQRVWVLEEVDGTLSRSSSARLMARCTNASLPGTRFLVQRSNDPMDNASSSALVLPPQLDYLAPGDFIAVSPDGWNVRVIWRHQSPHNALLLTERCDNYCLMCSQPPKEAADDYLLAQAFDLVRLLPQDAEAFTLTGGEPTLYGDGLLQLLKLCGDRLPATHVQLLTNGRRFADAAFAMKYATVTSERIIAAIPLHAAEPQRHDHIAQAKGAFNETVRGILNLARLEQRVEVRVVLHKQTIPVIGDIADFISRNLPFIERVALMGLELTGLTLANIDELWIDPFDYRNALADAVSILDNAGVSPLVYNHQLCLLEPAIRRFAVKSISDWKNQYDPICDQCSARDMCGGFFYSARHRRSGHISPLEATSPEVACSSP